MNPWLIGAAAALALGGSILGGKAQKKALERQAAEVNKNENRQLAELLYAQEDLNTQAAEQMTDAMRESSRQLSMARVLAAEGHGILKARAFNINVAQAESLSRMDASRRSRMSALRQQQANVILQSDAARRGIKLNNDANQYAFLAEAMKIGGQALMASQSGKADKEAALNKRGPQ